MDVDCDYHWLLVTIISGDVVGGEMQCEGILLDVYHWSLVCSRLCGGGALGVDENSGSDEAVCTKRWVYHQVAEFVID